MKTITFQCKLLSDVVLNASGASEGRIPSHDYIPGSNFLGIVARQYNDAVKQNIAMDLFHNGNVRFGDAHMILKGKRSLKVPADWFYEKGKTLREGIHLHHKMDREGFTELTGQGIQLKQARRGFFIEDDGQLVLISAENAKNYAMKSAYDRKKRRAEDEKLFGYTSLRQGLRWQFPVSLASQGNTNDIAEFIKNNLPGHHNIGLSRSAQYGRVKIDLITEKDISRGETGKFSGEIIIYAESRLAFLDPHGQPTLRPDAEMFGLPTRSILWEKSQILTSRYAPWNGKRRTHDADRICIDKGSVIVADVEDADLTSLKSGIGYYKNDGFGKVLINPKFLCTSDEKGKLLTVLRSSGDIFSMDAKDEPQKQAPGSDSASPLIKWLQTQKQYHTDNQLILLLVNDFTKQYHFIFTGKFASQWGMIRSIAEQSPDYENLFKRLFWVSPGNRNENGFLEQGVAMKKWQKAGRKMALKVLLEDNSMAMFALTVETDPKQHLTRIQQKIFGVAL